MIDELVPTNFSGVVLSLSSIFGSQRALLERMRSACPSPSDNKLPPWIDLSHSGRPIKDSSSAFRPPS